MLGKRLLESVTTKVDKPTELEMAQFLFMEKGIGLEQFNALPIPYILSMISAHNYTEEQKIKAQEKGSRKK